jgi:transcriptional regulator of aromatic amino acid metabolism
MSDNVLTGVFDQKVYIVGHYHIIEHAQTEAFLRLGVPALNVLNGAQRLNDLNVLNKILMAAMSDMPDVPRTKMAVGARHRFLRDGFWASKSRQLSP